eukprot:6249282-Ditylum_brightwellii.AAC.1
MQIADRFPFQHNLKYWTTQSVTQIQTWLKSNIPFVNYCIKTHKIQTTYNCSDIRLLILGEEEKKKTTRKSQQKKDHLHGKEAHPTNKDHLTSTPAPSAPT